MATIRRRGTTWQVQVRRQGHSRYLERSGSRQTPSNGRGRRRLKLTVASLPWTRACSAPTRSPTCWNVMPPASSPGSVEGAASVTCSASLLFPLDFQKRSAHPDFKNQA